MGRVLPEGVCDRCEVDVGEDELFSDGYCDNCHHDMNVGWPKKGSAEEYIEAANPVFPFKKK